MLRLCETRTLEYCERKACYCKSEKSIKYIEIAFLISS